MIAYVHLRWMASFFSCMRRKRLFHPQTPCEHDGLHRQRHRKTLRWSLHQGHIEFNTSFDEGDTLGHYSVIDDSDFASGGFHSMEKALLGLHPFEECGKSGMPYSGTGRNRERRLTKDLSGTGVLPTKSPSRKCSSIFPGPRRKDFLSRTFEPSPRFNPETSLRKTPFSYFAATVCRKKKPAVIRKMIRVREKSVMPRTGAFFSSCRCVLTARILRKRTARRVMARTK